MPDRDPSSSRRRLALKFAAGIAAAAFALFAPLETGRVMMLVLFTVSWLLMIAIDWRDRARGRTSGLRTYIWVVGFGLVVLLLLLLYGP